MQSATHFGIGPGLRDSLKRAIPRSKRQINDYIPLYPEELFPSFPSARVGFADLLELENLLAKSVYATVVIVESAGSLVELGAFANHSELSQRLIVVLDNCYKGAESFIMLGPIALLKAMDERRIVFHNFTLKKRKPGNLAEKVIAALDSLGENTYRVSDFESPVSLQYILLLLLYISDGICYLDLRKVIVDTAEGRVNERSAALEGALNLLRAKKYVRVRKQGHDHDWRLNEEGVRYLNEIVVAQRERREIRKVIELTRILFMNHILRTKH